MPGSELAVLWEYRLHSPGACWEKETGAGWHGEGAGDVRMDVLETANPLDKLEMP